jgi:hypothetical protein
MMEELRNRMPEELVWHVVKYLKHPCAEIISNGFKSYQYFISCFDCHNYYYDPKFIRLSKQMRKYKDVEPIKVEHFMLEHYICYECLNNDINSDTDSDSDSDSD